MLVAEVDKSWPRLVDGQKYAPERRSDTALDRRKEVRL